MTKGTWVGIAVVVALAVGAYYFWPSLQQSLSTQMDQQVPSNNEQTSIQETSNPQVDGTWRSQSDAKFTREIRKDGTIVDRYEGDASAGVNGSWSSVDPLTETGLTVPAASLAGMTVIKVVWEGGVETTYFAINEIEGSSMTTTDLSGRGEVTTYTRVN